MKGKGATTASKRRQRKLASRRHRREAPAGANPRISSTELVRLHERLRELTETVDALRRGAVDAVVVSGPAGNQVYSLAGADHPYRIYVERMQEGAATLSREGVILYTNQRFSDMLGLPLERTIGSDLRPHIDADAWRQIVGVLGNGRHAVKHATLLRRQHGAPLPVTFSVSGLELEGQEMLCLVVTDLTAQHENSQLRIAKESAEQANAAKDEFLAALSHELRTPLTPALISAQNLERDPGLPAHLRGDVAAMRRNVELEARLIDDLLDLTRLTRGKLELRPSVVDLHRVLDEAIAICQPDIAAKRLTLEVHAEAVHVRTTGDSVRIEQVLWNLLRNAVKFTPEGGTITIRTRNAESGRVSIAIADTGIGFDGASHERIFQAFEQGGRHITRRFGGLGLGLAISRSIAEAHAGTITAYSAGPDLGATFTLELPVDTAVAAKPETIAIEVPVPASRETLRILLIEDHADTRMVLERSLRRHHHEVHAAGTAHEALEVAASTVLDVVISDLGLPDQSGLELMRQLRDRYGLRGIAVSGYGMEEDVAKSRAAGFEHHLTKPISLQQLWQVLGTFAMDGTRPLAPAAGGRS